MYQDRLAKGRALDVAAGLGENAAVLALAGWKVTAADISDEAVRGAQKRARELRAPLNVVKADALYLPFRSQFDVVVCTYFLERFLRLERLLNPGGTLFVESFTVDHLRYAPTFKREYCLEKGELRTLYPGLEEVLYREDDDGVSAFATLIARQSPG